MTPEPKPKRQADWQEPSIFQKTRSNLRTAMVPRVSEFDSYAEEVLGRLEPMVKRESSLNLPELSELEILRHYTRLSQMNFGVQTGFYPLGSCTMKYNPTINDRAAGLPGMGNTHPEQPEETVQGSLELMYELQEWLGEILGLPYVTLQPAAGAQGEYTGVMLIREYHHRRDEGNRNEMLIPDSAHGTNPASAAMAGFKVVKIPSAEDGTVDLEALKAAVGPNTAGLMMTNPNTLGVFEHQIKEVADVVHQAGGLVYYDGANLNAIFGIVRPGDMGFDVAHINLHKSFSTPHGGGGPGSGVVAVNEKLEKYLPAPIVAKDGDRYYLNYDLPESMGKVKGYYGNFGVLVRTYTYIYMLGLEGLTAVAKNAVLNANYMCSKVSKIKGYAVPYKSQPHGLVKHEFVASPEQMKKDTGISALDISKRLLDYLLHPPTIYFPLIVPEALMIEPTETETKENMDEYVDVLGQIAKEAYETPEVVRSAPHNTTVGRVDDVRASRNPVLSERMK